MMHMSISQWRKYVMDELHETEREVYENHLYTCDQCLELYLQAVAEFEAELPTISNETALLDAIMAEVGKEPFTHIHPIGKERKREEQKDKVVSLESRQKTPSMQTSKQQPFYQSTVFHYLLATAMTLLLMGSGVFSSMTDLTEAIEQPKQTEKPSFTEGLLNKTFTWMDEIDEKLKEEPKLKSEEKQKESKEVGK